MQEVVEVRYGVVVCHWKQCISNLQALSHDAKINVLILILAKPVLHLRAMHILFAGLEGPREAGLGYYCFKCVAFESDAYFLVSVRAASCMAFINKPGCNRVIPSAAALPRHV